MAGKADRIILRRSSLPKFLTDIIEGMVSWIAPVEMMPGEYEMEALAAGALRVLRGEEASGLPVKSRLRQLAESASARCRTLYNSKQRVIRKD